jgi:hypothetical protein
MAQDNSYDEVEHIRAAKATAPVAQEKSLWQTALDWITSPFGTATASAIVTPGKGSGLAAPAPIHPIDDNPPNYPFWDPRGWPDAFQKWIDSWPSDNKPSMPTAEPTIAPTQTLSPTPTITPKPTVFPTPTIIPTLFPSKTPDTRFVFNIDGPMTVDQIPIEFRCTLDEFNEKFKDSEGKLIPLDQYYRCQLGESLIQRILTDENGWWWHNGENRGVKWQQIETSDDVWKFALTLGLDAEGTNLRNNDPDFAKIFSVAFRNKLWYLDHDMLPTYKNIIDYDSPRLGYNGRLVFLGSLEALEKRTTDMINNNKPASEALKTPIDGYTTNGWETAHEIIESFVWPEPTWKCPPSSEPFDWANPYSETPPEVVDAMLKGELGQGKNQIIYMNTQSKNIKEWLYILTLEQKEYFYGHKICIP